MIEDVTDVKCLQKLTAIVEILKDTVVVSDTLRGVTMCPNKYVILDQAGSATYWTNIYFYEIPVYVKMTDDDKEVIRVSSFYMKKDDVDNYRKGDPLGVNGNVIYLKDLGIAVLDEL